MPITVTIAKYDPCTIPEVDIEIPDKCPGCGADLTAEGAIMEGQFLWSAQHCNIDTSEQPPVRLEYHSSKDNSESCVVVGYTCDACGYNLTSRPGAGPAQPANITEESQPCP